MTDLHFVKNFNFPPFNPKPTVTTFAQDPDITGMQYSNLTSNKLSDS